MKKLISLLFISTLLFSTSVYSGKHRNNFFHKCGNGIKHAVRNDAKATGGGCATTAPANLASVTGGTKKITLCGERLDVPVIFYAACIGISASLPANCTVGAALTEGTSCWASISAMSIACGVSVAAVLQVARACIADDS